MKQKLLKIVAVERDALILGKPFSRRRLAIADIERIEIQRIPSLFDEIGIVLGVDPSYAVTERDPKFFSMVSALGIEKKFGLIWYRDAEDGRELIWEAPAHRRSRD